MRFAVIALMILPALARRISSPLAGPQHIADDENIAAEEREFQEEFPIAEETDYMSQRQEDEQPAVLPAEAFGVKQKDLEKLYKRWVETVPSDGDSSVSAFLQWMEENNEKDKGLSPGQQSVGKWWKKIWDRILKKKSRRTANDENIEAERELQEFPIAEDYMSQREQNEQTSVPPSEGPAEVYDCEKNSPCTAENIANELFYFAAKDPTKFIQCSTYGTCSEISCQYGLIWDDEDKTCSFPE